MPSAQLPTPDPQDDRYASHARPQDAPVPASEAPAPEGIAATREGTVDADEDTEYEPL